MIDMMDSKTTRTAAVLLCCLTAVVLAVNFTWTGGAGGNHNWNAEANWDPPPFCYASPYCYPRTTSDDATVAENDNVVLVADEEIDDLSINNDDGNGPTFDGGGSTTTLTCNTVTISGNWCTDTLTKVVECAKITTVDE